MIKTQAKELLSREMSRMQFLQIVGVAILTILGVNNFVSLLHKSTQTSAATDTTRSDASRGFGSSKFGV